jgi:hypothetical protein
VKPRFKENRVRRFNDDTAVLSALNQSEKERYLLTVAEAVATFAGANSFGLGRLYELFATAGLGPVERRRIVKGVIADTVPPRARSPRFSEASTRFSLAKDVLAIAVRGHEEDVPGRIPEIVQRFHLSPEQLEALRWWVYWEREVRGTIERGSVLVRAKSAAFVTILGNELSFLAHVLKALVAVRIPPNAVYLSGNPVAFSAASALDRADETDAVILLIGLGTSIRAASTAFKTIGNRFLEELIRDVLPDVSRSRMELRVAVKAARDLRGRYLCALQEDNALLVRDPGWADLAARARSFEREYRVLKGLLEREREKPTTPTKPAKKVVLIKDPKDVLERVVAFGNEDLSSEKKREEWIEGLLALSLHTGRADIRDLPEIHREIRDILTHLSSGDRWAADPEYTSYRDLAIDPKWKLPGLGEFDDEPTEATTWRPLSVDFRWQLRDPLLSEATVVEDLRSGVLIRFRDALKSFSSRKGRLRRRLIAKCPVCGKFLFPQRKQLYCLDGACSGRANEGQRERF